MYLQLTILVAGELGYKLKTTYDKNRKEERKCTNNVKSYDIFFQESLVTANSKVKTLKLTMMDNVSLIRNISTVAEIVTNFETVILHDLLLDTEGWNVMAKAFAKPEKIIKRLELFQILGVSTDNASIIGKCLKDTPDVLLRCSGKLGIT